ncbi:hypothetical protein [Clostridium manihotivorum]|uniref:hypothetical protein n=1 Tax=Clostridium manihotivorum TaxID=2320868 RepID=UPI0026927631
MNEVERSRSKNLSKEQITSIIKKIDDYSNLLEWETEAKVDLKVSEFIEYKNNISYSNKRFFLKPLGSAQEPFSTSRSLSSDVENIHFSKRRPASVRVGDILICYAVGSGKLLGLFEVIEEPMNSRIENDRWPWFVKAKNLCVTYSESWYHYENTVSSVQSSFKMDTAITYVGGKTLGALKRGADKIQLTEEFANHIINIIKEKQ